MPGTRVILAVLTAPESCEDLKALLSGRPTEEQLLVLERIQKCHHPSLAVGNRAKLEVRGGPRSHGRVGAGPWEGLMPRAATGPARPTQRGWTGHKAGAGRRPHARLSSQAGLPHVAVERPGGTQGNHRLAPAAPPLPAVTEQPTPRVQPPPPSEAQLLPATPDLVSARPAVASLGDGARPACSDCASVSRRNCLASFWSTLESWLRTSRRPLERSTSWSCE